MEITLNISDVAVNPEFNSAEIVVTPTFSSGVPDVNKKYVDAALDLKVDKVANHSLVPNSEINKLAEYPEYDDMATKEYVNGILGDINTALETILAIEV